MDGTGYIDKSDRLEQFMRSEAGNLPAEIFIEELQYVMREEVLSHVVVKNHGMNPRVQSKDILNVGIKNVFALGELIELSLARNSIYHQLPEFLFHPLTLGENNMSQREIVEAIKTNKRKEEEAVRFFSPFDTAFFKERVKIHKRYLDFFSNSSSHENLNSMIKAIIGKEMKLSSHEQHKLFYFLCHAESYKENLSELSFLLYEVLGLDVKLAYSVCMMTGDAYALLGNSILGIDSGLAGEYEDETDDIEGTIVYHDTIPEMNIVEDHIQTIKNIMDYFMLSKRKISLKYTFDGQVDCIIGENRLGFDTHL